MMPTGTVSSVSLESARRRSATAEAIKEAWRVGQRPDALAALRENPDIAADRAVAMDLAYEEFCTREEAGETLDSESFCACFSFGTSLHRLLAVHRFLDDHPDALGDVPTTWPRVGEHVGDFLVVRELGRGGFSRVYLCVEGTAGDRPIALKVAAAGSREAQTLGPLSHPHLIPVLSSRAIEAWTVVAMPFSGTATLEDLVSAAWSPDRSRPPRSAGAILGAAVRGRCAEDPPFPSLPKYPVAAGMTFEEGVSAIASGLFDALAYLHDKGIAHRDLKPSNVLLGPTGHPYVLDFNLAATHTDTWRLVGTLPYMAPEQLVVLCDPREPPPTDSRRADIFACGVILFELFTGHHPFGPTNVLSAFPARDDPAAALLRIQRTAHPDLALRNPQVKPAVRRMVERCLSIDPDVRPSAAQLAAFFSPVRIVRSRLAIVLMTLVLASIAVLSAVLSLGLLSPRQTITTEATSPSEVPELTDPFERGMQLLKQGQHGLAAVEFLAVGKANSDGRAYAWAAYCLSLRKESKGAANAADEAIRLGYRTAPVLANRAYNRLQVGRLQEALEDCDEALRLDPNLRAARFSRTFIHLQLHLQKGTPLPPDAVADIEQVLTGTPNTADVWITAAHVFVLAPGGDPAWRDKAARAVREAVLTGKSPETIRRNAALMSALSGHPVIEEALSLKPGPADPLINPQLCSPIP